MKISVAMCTYNGEKYIKEQLDSIISQTRIPDEIIVGDDGSSDATVKIAKKILSNSSITSVVIENKKNLGVNANFQNVIDHCTGDIIFTSDQDDIWVDNKIETMVSYFEKEPNDVLVFSNGYVTDEKMNVTGDMWSGFHFTKEKQEKFSIHKYFDVLFSKNYIAGTAMAFKRDFAKNLLDYPFMTYHDYWLALHAPLYGDIGMIETSLIYYRQHENNVVGVRPNKTFNKMKRWIKNSKYALDNSKERYIMSQSFYEINQDRLQEINLLKETEQWVQFNSWRYSLKGKNKAKAVFEVFEHMITGSYKCFYSRSFSGIQDSISCLLS